MPSTAVYRLDTICRQFAEAAAQDPFGTVLILPTAHLAREVVHRLDAEGTPLVADAVTTLSGLAARIFENRATVETLISDTESRLVVAHLLAAEPGRFPLLAGTGAVDDLATLFSVLVTRKVDYPAALGDLQSAKSAEIGDLLDAYRRFLDDHALVDGSTLFSWVARRATGFRTVFVYGLFEPVAVEQEFLLALCESAEAFCDIPASSDTDRPCSDVRITERRDRLDEVRAIAQEIRDLIAAGVRPGEIAVAFPDFEPAIPYVEEVFADFGIPYAASSGRALTGSPLVRSLLDILSVPIFGCRREDVAALAASPYTGLSPEIDLLSRESGIVAGAGTWDARLAGLAATLAGEQSLPGTPEHARRRLAAKIAAIESARKDIRSLFADLAALDGSKTIPEHLAAYRSILERRGWPAMPEEGNAAVLEREERDLGAFAGLLESLERFSRVLPERPVPLAEFASLLGLLAAGTRPPRTRNRNAVQVVGLRELAHLQVPSLFIAGLVEGVMPRLTTRLPLATDLETRRLGTRTAADILREERHHFTAALLAGTERLYLSFPAADGTSPLIPSPFLDAVRDEIATVPWGSTDFPASRTFAARNAGARLARGEAAAADADAARRLAVETAHRQGAYASSYDAVLTAESGVVATLADRFGPAAVFSPTALETYADCPFRFYVSRVLGLAPLPAVDRDLTGLERGSLLHRIAFRFYADWRADGNAAVTAACYPDALQRILAIGREEADRFAFASPAWAAERQHLLGSPEAGAGLLERFLCHEAAIAASGFVPDAFEVSFGLPIVPGTCDPGSTPDAVAVPLGDEVVRIRGRVDRVDRLPDGRFLVTDYKTGSTHPGLREIASGRALQLPLYLRALETLTGTPGVAGTYYTLRRGTVQNKPVFRDADLATEFAAFPPSRSGVADVRELVDASLAHVQRYLGGIRSGWFAPRSDPGPCPRYCDFQTVCRFDAMRLLEEEEEP
ncbi:PD-(D/E)XK nuclease family protein [Methanoculleus sp. FWC-SCC1]|uniref:PD-(D/E)XK nuclease family protein n=1 Tax=Methanoculleus frigidifontis TaxID=2584085 RepID=A0ABT8M795_9EURY|nr:PD-(D/E)XK nuclease family protein [Methanoculleus sp. FWC-SCC1]MDN7023804.1 PD-(D/E)XK nuclease family protein [Methanoculleus sp. FWC-SCC1]